MSDDRAFTIRAAALERFIDEDLPLQTQHAPKRGSLAGKCGAFGAVTASEYGVTCDACKALMARAAKRRAK